MKVKTKDLLFSSLPSSKDKKKLLKAQAGKRLGETGTYPIDFDTLQSDYFDNLAKVIPTGPQMDPTKQYNPAIDTSKIPGPKTPTTQVPTLSPPQERRKGPNIGEAVMFGAAAFDALLPEEFNKQTVVQPQMGYNPYLYGTGSQAIAAYGGYIKDDGNTPSAQAGGQATRQDSLDLYNNANQLLQYYDNSRYQKDFNTRLKIPRKELFDLIDYDQEVMEGRKMALVDREMRDLGPNDYRKPVDKNRFYQRESANAVIDLRAPMALYDRRISPTHFRGFKNRIPGDINEGDDVGIYTYDPIAVKPWDMLTPEERTQRMKLYPSEATKSRPPVKFPEHKATKVKGADMTEAINVQGTGIRSADLSQKPTKYSVTVRDENAPGKQRSIYFKDKKAWRDFMDAGAVNPISSSEMEDSATAAGYRAMQAGGRLPIYTNDPNDPRIQRYNDSMLLHKTFEGDINRLKTMPQKEWWDYVGRIMNSPRVKQAEKAFDRLGQPKPIATYTNDRFDNRLPGDLAQEYAKPVQPVIYQPERNIPATQLQGSDMTQMAGVNPSGRLLDLSQKPTKYSVTMRDESAPGKQRSVYFKNKKEWKNFMDSGAINMISSSESEDAATAAGYSAFQYGGEIPMAKSGHWIQNAINPAHKGYCTPMTKSTCTPRRKALAKTLKKMAKKRKHADGGIIPDNMSVFNPHMYENGGNVNGGANIQLVGGKYPNTDLLEQWLLYKAGGSVNGEAIVNDVSGVYPNADLMEQWLLYKDGGQVNWTGKEFKEVPGNYPNTDLLEQWIQYKQGGQVNWNGREFRDVGPRYPNTDLLEQWLTYQQGGPVNNTGYLDGSTTAGNPYNIIPGGDITMQGVSQPIMARPIKGRSLGEEMMMVPGENYNFNSDAVMEYPMAAGGQLSPEKAREMLRDGTANGKKLTKKQKRYFGMVAAGKAQMGTQVGNVQPAPQLSAQEKYYQASARLGHFKNILNDKLKAKNPQAFKDYFTGLTGLRRSGDTTGAEKYVQETAYDDYLTPQEVQSTLSPEDYNEYVGALQDVNSYNVQQGRQPLYGTKEGESDVRNLNYGRRFASLQLTPSLGVGNKEGTRNYSRQYTYNPTNRQVSFTESGDLALRPSYLSAPQPPIAGATASLKSGGVVYENGGEVGTMWGGSSELASYNPYDGGTIEFEGASHDDGGIGMHYNGKPVEVEGGEFASKDQVGNLNIYGNMVLPGTKTKFKSVAKEIAEKERGYDKLRTTGSALVENSNPANRYERLAFNAGTVMMMGGKIGQQDLAQKKEKLSALQKAMLDTAGEYGLDPEHLSRGVKKKAKKGARIYQSGGPVNDPTVADRHNNPGNIKWSKFAKKMGAKKGEAAPDGGFFAVFPNRDAGLKAMNSLLTSDSYKNLDVDAAISKWTGGHPYKYDLASLKGKKVGELTPQERQQMMNVMQVGEGTRYGPGAMAPSPTPGIPTFTPYGLPDVPGFTGPQQKPTPGTVNPPPVDLQIPTRPDIPSDVEPLHVNQLLGEIYGAATNHVEPVPAQRYEPQLFSPYQVSFQDRLNQNQSGFSALQRSLGTTNPSALGALAAQKYQADNAVKAEEFRTNQAIANDVTNKNVALLNDAELKNLAIADTQMVRQSTARSKTRQMNQMILNSISSKYAQNQYENKRLAAYENLYDYRFVPQKDGGLKATYYGPNALFNFSGKDNQAGTDVRTVTRYDQYGNVKGVTEYDDYDLREMQRELDVEMRRRKMPLLTTPKLQ